MKQKAYIYPITNRLKTGIYNPYLDNFIRSSENSFYFLNKEYPSDTGIFNLLRFIFKTDVIFLNWIENLPEKKGGFLQTVFFLALLRVSKLFGIKIVWTIHNKISHSSKHLFFKQLIFSEMLKRSDIIISHSKEGVRFAETLCPGVSQRIFYFPHPVIPVNGFSKTKNIEYDILIWGTLAPYKGIDSFLEFLQQNNSLQKYRILIAGRAVSDKFYKKIQKYASHNITIKDQFVDHEELSKLIHSSRIVLFTYSGNSVLSSGALMDSVANRALVIGPSRGAFAEMGSLGIIKTYNDFNDLLEILNSPDELEMNISKDKINHFIHSHTWQQFSEAFNKRMESENRELKFSSYLNTSKG